MPTFHFTSWFLDYLKKLPLRILLLGILFSGALLLFALVAHEVLGENEEGFDNQVFQFFKLHIVNSSLTPFMKVVTFFASAPFQAIAYTALMLWFTLKKNRVMVLDIATIALSGFAITFLLKDIFHRARPVGPLVDPVHSFSFPSGHASSGFILYGLLAFIIWNEEKNPAVKYTGSVLLILFSILIGLSRIYLRVHYASDVLAGFCLGYAWLSLSLYILQQLKKRQGESNGAIT